jgi:hypothetical protein
MFLVELLDFCNGIAQKNQELPCHKQCDKSINANYKDGEMALKLK